MDDPDVPTNLNALDLNVSGIYVSLAFSVIELPLNNVILDPVVLPIDKLLHLISYPDSQYEFMYILFVISYDKHDVLLTTKLNPPEQEKVNGFIVVRGTVDILLLPTFNAELIDKLANINELEDVNNGCLLFKNVSDWVIV